MFKITNPVIFLALMMIVLQSCTDSKEDHSLSIKEYVRLGMPDYKKTGPMMNISMLTLHLARLRLIIRWLFQGKTVKSQVIFS